MSDKLRLANGHQTIGHDCTTEEGTWQTTGNGPKANEEALGLAEARIKEKADDERRKEAENDWQMK